MGKTANHLSDEQLLLLVDGELPETEAAKTLAHLKECADCRIRRSRIEAALGELVQFTQAPLASELPPSSDAHVLLKLRLQDETAAHAPWYRRLGSPMGWHPRIYVFASLLIVTLAAGFYRQRVPLASKFAIAYAGEGRIPNRALTPGATRPVTLADICPVVDDEDNGDLDPAVPSSTQKVVFQEYGIAAESSAKDYQVDYLINPQLGGTNDVRNLWPEPYSSTVWNAQVKDALENRLHQMVCEQKIDLASAQRDLATDWISAYKKYFHSSKPV